MLMHDTVELTQRVITDEGYLEVPAVFARSGIYQYTAAQIGMEGVAPDTVIDVWRPEDEVFDEASMASFGRKPVTNDHPSKPVTLSNFKAVAVGMSDPDVVRDGMLMRGRLVITDAAAIEDINSGKKELSNGYAAEYDFETGVTPRGDSYKAIQRKMRGNHIAIVDRGRCGAVCTVADDAKGTSMAKVKITLDDGSEVEVDEAIAATLQKSNDQRDAAVDDLKARKGKVKAKARGKGKGKRTRASDEDPEELSDEEEPEDMEELEDEEEPEDGDNPFAKKGEDAALRKRLAKAEAALDSLRESQPTDDELDARVETRAKVVSDSKRLMGKTYCTDGKTNTEIRREVVADRVETDITDKSDDYVEARFDSLTAGGGESKRFASRNLGKSRKTSDGFSKIAEARAKQVADIENAWKRDEDKQTG